VWTEVAWYQLSLAEAAELAELGASSRRWLARARFGSQIRCC
jgi:hypothetical protein